MVSAPMSSSSSSTQSQQQQQQDCPDQQQDQQQLYYAQLLAAQQQAIISSSASSTSSNSSEKNGGETGNNSIDGEMAKSEAAKKESDREKKEREWSERNTNLIVNYVPQNMTQEEVRALFGSMGEVESCKLIRDKATGQSLGYAFVNYERPEDAQKALISMNGLRIQNKTLKVSLARPSKDDIKGANLYVSGLPKSLTQPELEAAFRVYGSIITSRILYDNVTGLSKGVGFVRFDRKLEAEQAIDKMTGTSPWGGDEPVTVKFANSPSTNSAKSTAIQMAQSLLPLHQMLQPNGCAASAASVTAVNAAHPSLLPSLIPSLSAAHQPHPSSSMANVAAAAGGPIHAHTPQHRFRYSPLAGAPLISTSAPMVSSAQTAGSAMALSAAGVNPLLASAVNPTALVTSMAHQQQQQQQQDYLALLQQQLLQQQLAAYAAAMATNPQQQQHQAMSSLSQMVAAQQQQQQQQYSAYAAALSAAGMASTTAAGQSAVAAVGTLNGLHHHQQSKSPSTNSSAAASGWTLSICNLAPETEESLLWKLFGPFGAVLSVQVLKGKGIGLVTMANYEEAYAAISGLNGQQLGGRTLQVAYSSNQAAAGAVTAAGLPSLLRS